MKITVLYGTETGNSELVADDIQDALSDEFEVECRDMAKVNLGDISSGEMLFIICSTYGEGELPNSAQPFFESLNTKQPDLTGVKFATFGLGDSFYETFNKGSDIIASKLIKLGATEIGTRGVHDASSGLVPSDVALTWLEEIKAVFN